MRFPLTFALPLTTLLAIAGCHSSGGDASAGDASSASNADQGGACPSDVDADLTANGDGPWQVAATGGAKGSSLECTFCGVGVSLVTSAGESYPTLYVASAPGSTMTCASPGDASNVLLQGTLALPSAKPGVYQGSPSSYVESNDCDQLVVAYNLPGDAGGPDCGTTGLVPPGACPTECLGSCIDAGPDAEVLCACQPGEPQAAEEYALSNGCGSAPGSGSWTVTLTSVAPVEDSGSPAGNQAYVVHGSLSATVLDTKTQAPVTTTLMF